MLVECCKKSEILVAFLSSAIFRELPVYVGQAVPFFIVKRILPIAWRLQCVFFTVYLKRKKRIGK